MTPVPASAQGSVSVVSADQTEPKAVDTDGDEEERPGKRNKWVYRIGGVVVMVLTLKLPGVI